MKDISKFMEKHFRHFNARETLEAARQWNNHLDSGGKMFLTLAGAMSTAEIGVILARMIREGKVHAISCTAANLEEDIFNLVAHNDYEIIESWRNLTPQQEADLYERGFNRVTDTCIPETVFRDIEAKLLEYWQEASNAGTPLMPCEFFFRLHREGVLKAVAQVPMEDSWVVAACEMGIPIFTPGLEDSTLGNIYTARVMEGKVKDHRAICCGTEQFEKLCRWYEKEQENHSIGFFQIGGGIAGDFAICSVPCLIQDMKKDVKFWGYFAQISDSTTSYGSYSGAIPSEKITWGKLDVDTPSFMINSDAAIVAPLIFAYVLGD